MIPDMILFVSQFLEISSFFSQVHNSGLPPRAAAAHDIEDGVEHQAPDYTVTESYKPTPKTSIPLPWFLDITRKGPPQDEIP